MKGGASVVLLVGGRRCACMCYIPKLPHPPLPSSLPPSVPILAPPPPPPQGDCLRPGTGVYAVGGGGGQGLHRLHRGAHWCGGAGRLTLNQSHNKALLGGDEREERRGSWRRGSGRCWGVGSQGGDGEGDRQACGRGGQNTAALVVAVVALVCVVNGPGSGRGQAGADVC